MNPLSAPLQYARDVFQGILNELVREDLRNVKRDVAETFNGALTISGLLSVPGGQIKFPATQVPSTDANTLDDYEEGTVTVTIGDGTNNYTISSQVCDYTKLGRVVVARLTVNWSSIGSAGAGQLRIGGLPLTASSGSHAGSIGSAVGLDYTATLNPIICYAQGADVFFERVNDNAAETHLAANGSSATGGVSLTVTYSV